MYEEKKLGEEEEVDGERSEMRNRTRDLLS